MKKIGLFVLAALFVAFGAGGAFAFTPPSTGSMAYEIYDIAVNDILNGPIGYVAGLGMISFGLYAGVMGKGQISTSILSILAGGAVANAEGITNTLGFNM